MPSELLRIRCWMYDDDFGKVQRFPVCVELSKAANGQALQRAILSQTRPCKSWGQIPDAADLELYTVSDGPDLSQRLRYWVPSVESRLLENTYLSKIFCPVGKRKPPVVVVIHSVLTLHCGVFKKDSEAIPVRVLRTNFVSDLAGVIKQEGPSDLRDGAIQLYRIECPRQDYPSAVRQLTASDLGSPLQDERLSDVFPILPRSDMVHVLVIPQETTMTLNCWMRGTGIDNVFSVKIPPTETVASLKQLIRDEKLVDFHDADANNLVLYKVSLPWDDDFTWKLDGLELKQTLLPLEILSDVFLKPDKKDIHVIVESPLSGVRAAPPAAEEEDIDMLAPVIRSFKLTIMSKSPTPSPAATLKGYISIQSGDQRILDCRSVKDSPVDTVAPPIQLFNPAFAFFSSHAFDPEYDVPHGVMCDVWDLMIKFAQIHNKEDNRRDYLLSSLSKVINRPLASLSNADKTSPDLVATGECGELQTYLVIAEEKNEFGDGELDPSVHAAFLFRRIFCQQENEQIRLKCCCPAFIIAHAGPWFTILGGIITGDCIVQRLTDYLWIPVHSTHDNDQFLRTARIFHALRKSIELLDSWYKYTIKEVPAFNELLPRPHPRFFPSPNAYRDGDDLVRFQYQVPLKHDVTCVTYRAKTVGDNPNNIVVKFVTSYGVDAHQEMALAGLAPKLLYYGQIDVEKGMPLYGNLRMVVMEYVDGLTLNKALEQGEVPQGFQSDLCKAFQHLHDAGYVFGDLRPPNVMVTRKGKLQLINFDWAGRDGEARYPVSISSSINWPAGVQRLELIRKEHDSAMLDTLLTSISAI